jgi:p-aminobenzoyl-glutamate transporter AbgT
VETQQLTAEQKKGIKVAIVVVMLVFLLFLVVLVSGQSIMAFQNEPVSVAYAVLVYTPVMALCALAYIRLQRR